MRREAKFGDSAMPERIWLKTSQDPITGCWVWNGSLSAAGYGFARVAAHRRMLIHRWSYSLFYGDLSQELVIDHLCSNRRCFNPGQLEQVTREENSRRGAHSRPRT